MKKIRIEFRDENSTEFKLELPGVLTHRELLVLARVLPLFDGMNNPGDNAIIEIEISGIGWSQIHVRTYGDITSRHLHLVADEFYLVAQHIFFTQQNQAMMAAARRQIIVPQARIARG